MAANAAIERELGMGYTEDQLRIRAEADALLMGKMQVFIGFSGVINNSETSDVPADRLSLYAQHYGEQVHGKIRVPKPAGLFSATPPLPWRRWRT